MTDLVSIGLPVYNGERFLRRALESLLAQDYPEIEVIVSDNASTDGTAAIIAEFAARDRRVIAHRQASNIGATANFQFVLGRARGPFFMWAACDDWWDTAFVSTLAAALHRHPGHGVCMSSLLRVDENGATVDEILLAGDNDLTSLSYGPVFRRMTKSVRGVPIHIFIYGLFRTPILRAVASRPFPTCIAPDRVLMSEVALATHFCCVTPILHRRTVRAAPLETRYGTDAIGTVWRGSRRMSRYLGTLLVRLATSRAVPLGRKLRYVPVVWLQVVWRRRHAVFQELMPRRRPGHVASAGGDRH